MLLKANCAELVQVSEKKANSDEVRHELLQLKATFGKNL
jgi:hypothetical protein